MNHKLQEMKRIETAACSKSFDWNYSGRYEHLLVIVLGHLDEFESGTFYGIAELVSA